jgi:hypothetical protein
LPKKVTKEKRFPEKGKPKVSLLRGFSDSPFHGSVGKRRASMHAALRVWGMTSLFVVVEVQEPN